MLAVVEDEVRHLDTISTPDFLGLTAPGGAWEQGHRGNNVVIGVVDSGIWPESDSFCDKATKPPKNNKPAQPCKAKKLYKPPRNWDGACQTRRAIHEARLQQQAHRCPLLQRGRGWRRRRSRTTSPTNTCQPATPTDMERTRPAQPVATVVWRSSSTVCWSALASGMAPRARLAAYKVCWGREADGGGCSTSDSVAAIDQAVADGVDVINYSISGSTTQLLDPVEVSFFNASAAGVFVATSAGNDGPGASTVAHNSPWITTVAASTHDRASDATLTLGNGASYTGASFQKAGTAVLPLVYAGDVPADGADPADAALCFPDSLDTTAVAGAIVICDRGVNARDEKSFVIREAGGAAMVLANTAANSINADIHYVPSIHVNELIRAALLDYVHAGGSPTGQLSPGVSRIDESAPQPAVFSSQGPSLASADVLKPDLTAPGVDVIAAVAPPGQHGRAFNSLSGTSMSSPHIAGLAAVVRSAHRDWTPASIKSALMTTAYEVAGASPFEVGSGHVDINPALDPGLVYNVRPADYIGFLCGTGQYVNPAQCDVLRLDPSDLNQPNIAIGELAGTQTVTRTVTNVGRRRHLSPHRRGSRRRRRPGVTQRPRADAWSDRRATRSASPATERRSTSMSSDR